MNGRRTPLLVAIALWLMPCYWDNCSSVVERFQFAQEFGVALTSRTQSRGQAAADEIKFGQVAHAGARSSQTVREGAA